MQAIPQDLTSVQGPSGSFLVRWSPAPESAEVQCWHLVRCDYPISVANASGLMSGGLDLMVKRWELNPSVTEVYEDTGVAGKHYTVLGVDADGRLVFPGGLTIDPTASNATALSGERAHQGWIKGVKKRDRHSNVF